MMHFDLKNHGQDFTNMKLSELSERANHVLSALQIALGFVMAFNTAILAVLIAVGQTINQNCNWSCPESFKSLLSACEAILGLPNFIPWLACAVCAYVGGRTNLVALKIHVHLIAYHDDTVVKVYNSFFDGDAECHTGEEPPASVGEDNSGNIVSPPESIEEKSQFKLPESRERLGDGIIERIYSFTAYCFFFLCSLFLTCAFTSFTYFVVIKGGSIYVCIIIFFIVSFVALITTYFVLFNQTNSNYKPWIVRRLSQLKDFLLKKFR